MEKITDRLSELQSSLPPKDWENYSRNLPIYARSGDNYGEIYLGRDIAGESAPRWRLYLLTGGVCGLGIFQHLIQEQTNWMVGIAIAGVAGIDMAFRGKFFDKLYNALDIKKRIINP